jgi:hypothetical protein
MIEKSKKDKVQSAVLGAAGEHLAISHLLRRNLVAGLAPQNTENFDIVVMSKSGQFLFPVQVKTSKNKNTWMLGKKHEASIENLIYILIRFSQDLNTSEIFVLDSEKISEVIKMSHQIWLKLPSKDGGKHRDTDIRNLNTDNSTLIRKVPNGHQLLSTKEIKFIENHSMGWLEKYRENWNLFS